MITVLAGVNGAGKSSLGGAAIRQAGGTWYDPDALARALQRQFPEIPLETLNGRVWAEGVRRLEAAIRDDRDFVFETTLGGRTITDRLLDAMALGRAVSLWYWGLDSVELHIERVAARAARGGHWIPPDLIRRRHRHSMTNLCRLAPGARHLVVYDNSAPLDANGRPQSRRLILVRNRRLEALADPMPDWARPVAAVCLTHFSNAQ